MNHSYKRWYDLDPVLSEVINLLQNYQEELRAQAEIFLTEIEKKVSKDAIDKFYELARPKVCNRWYDKDPVISKAIELLRVVPVNVQKEVSERFLSSLEKMGITKEEIQKTISK